jgi:hypothetical protein
MLVCGVVWKVYIDENYNEIVMMAIMMMIMMMVVVATMI